MIIDDLGTPFIYAVLYMSSAYLNEFCYQQGKKSSME